MCKEAAVYKLESLPRKLPGRTERNLTAAVIDDYGPKFKYGTSRRSHKSNSALHSTVLLRLSDIGLHYEIIVCKKRPVPVSARSKA